MTSQDQSRDEIVQEIVSRIVEVLDPERIILFGSWARGEAGPDSDLDLAVIAETDEPRERRLGEARRLMPPLSFGLDLVLFTPHEWEYYGQVHSSFQSEIRDTGKVLYERSGSPTRAGASVA